MGRRSGCCCDICDCCFKREEEQRKRDEERKAMEDKLLARRQTRWLEKQANMKKKQEKANKLAKELDESLNSDQEEDL